MTKSETRVMDAIRFLGGEATTVAIHRRFVETSRFGNSFFGELLVGFPLNTLDRLERSGLLTSRLGEPTAVRGWRLARIYKMVETLQDSGAKVRERRRRYGR